MIGILIAIAIAAIAYVELLRRKAQTERKLRDRIAELGEELEIRQLYAEAVRHDLRLLGEFWSTECSDYVEAAELADLEAFERLLEKKLEGSGLMLDGSPAFGLTPANELAPGEWAKLSRLTLHGGYKRRGP